MKGFYKDSKEWEIVVIGDWRDKNGKTTGYDEDLADKRIFISGGQGMYFFMRGDNDFAIYCWMNDLQLIKKIEKQQGVRFHKGWFYYQLGISHQNMNHIIEARNYLRLAKQQDIIAYGKKAKTFPATKRKL